MVERTCLVTRTKADPKDLLRFVIAEDQLIFDESVKQPGRGGYVLKDLSAIEKLPKMAGKITYFLKAKRVVVSDQTIEKAKALIDK